MKWSDKAACASRWADELRRAAHAGPFTRGRKVTLVLWLKEGRDDLGTDVTAVTPGAVLDALR